MLGIGLGSVSDLLAMLGVSTETLMLVAVVTTVMAAAMLTGQAARLGVWLEDLMYRVGMWNG